MRSVVIVIWFLFYYVCHVGVGVVNVDDVVMAAVVSSSMHNLFSIVVAVVVLVSVPIQLLSQSL